MQAIKTSIEGLLLLKPYVFTDGRGCFFESWNRRKFEAIVPGVVFVQDNESCSTRGVIRGLHFQKGASAQAKLVSVAFGEILDVALDLRPDSPTRGKHFAVRLSSDNHMHLFIPRGFAHGFSVLSPTAVFRYKCDNFYDPSAESGVLYNDPALGIDWGISEAEAIVSDKDRRNPKLADICGAAF